MLENVVIITPNLEVVFLAKMMIQKQVENVGRTVSPIVKKEAFARNYRRLLFVIVIVDDMHCH